MAVKRNVLTWGAVLVFSFSLGAARTAVAAQASLPPGALTIHLESDLQVYHVSEPVKIRISIRNNTSDDYAIAHLPPWALFDLIISNKENEPLKSNGIQAGYVIRAASERYRARSTEFIGFWAPPFTTERLSYWAPVSYWGYNLNIPGNYTITAIPNFTTWTSASPAIERRYIVSSREKSNAVSIEVVR